ncbi:hypothetical protein GCM10023093_09810 [Nemorincola caseinilytica]|uniref:PDZ domain-containing protein n=2 Tax=Nemorincola caseinilytica TaxID=2054315 RepID=A0ABP8N9F3_9BACT
MVITLCCVSGALPAQQPKTNVTLGIKPDYWYTTSGDGVRVNDVLPGQTAAQAGIKAGDIITALDKKNIKNIFAYKDVLGTYHAGDSVVITLLRDKKPMVIRTRFAKD